MSSTPPRCRLVYARLYGLPLRDRLNRAWTEQLRCQILAMRRALSFMLSPCVEHIMSFLELDDALVHVCLLLRQRRSDLGIPIIQRRVVRFLDDYRFGVRSALRAIVLQYFWDNYVGRPPDWQGDVFHWRCVCQEMYDYLGLHSRCRSRCDNVLTEEQLDSLTRFEEQLDSLTEPL